MENETQFRVNSVEELEQAYNHFKDEWFYSLDNEKKDFIKLNSHRYVLKDGDGGIILYSYDENYKEVPNPLKEKKEYNKYAVEIKGVELDVYDILDAHNVRNPALQHLIKKCLHGGMRGHKSREQDLKDIIASSKRAHELEFKNN